MYDGLVVSWLTSTGSSSEELMHQQPTVSVMVQRKLIHNQMSANETMFQHGPSNISLKSAVPNTAPTVKKFSNHANSITVLTVTKHKPKVAQPRLNVLITSPNHRNWRDATACTRDQDTMPEKNVTNAKKDGTEANVMLNVFHQRHALKAPLPVTTMDNACAELNYVPHLHHLVLLPIPVHQVTLEDNAHQFASPLKVAVSTEVDVPHPIDVHVAPTGEEDNVKHITLSVSHGEIHISECGTVRLSTGNQLLKMFTWEELLD